MTSFQKWSAEDGASPPISAGYGGRFAVSLSAHKKAGSLAGKIDRIVTKSVSRFARNTVDTLTTIRKLKEKGVGVTFEKENIDTEHMSSELMLSILSSIAESE